MTSVASSLESGTRTEGKLQPRLGFLGVGWIGRNRMEALAKSQIVEIAAIADPSIGALDALEQFAPGASRLGTLDELLQEELDGIVIATPSAMHAEQSIAALERGLAVFCQKPLGRDATETRRVLDAARAADRLLGVDLSYRHTAALEQIKRLVDCGELGRIYSAELVFHNAYGPDKPWFFDRAQSGGGCVIDLGIHLVDLALWLLGEDVQHVTSRLYAKGKLLGADRGQVEDHAMARLEMADGATVTLSCSWNAHAGRDAVIEVSLLGTRGGAAMRNVNGSFYDFAAHRFSGTTSHILCSPPDDWSGRAIVKWAERLSRDPTYDAGIEHVAHVASLLDQIYGRIAP